MNTAAASTAEHGRPFFIFTISAGEARVELLKKNLSASKPLEHPPSGEKVSKGLGGNIGCRDKTSSLYQMGSPM